MYEDTAAQILGAHVALSGRAAELWHRVALSELLPEEAEAQLLEGRDPSEEERAEIERAKLVFAPPTEAQREAQLEVLLARLAEDDEPGEAKEPTDEARARANDDAEATKTTTDAPAVVVPLRSHRIRRWTVGFVVAAAAVVLTVWLVPPPHPSPPDEVHRGPFVAQYRVELDVISSPHRSAPDQARPLGPQDELRITLRAEDVVDGPVGVVGYARDRSGGARRLELEPTVHANGVVELDTSVPALGLEAGEHELVFAVGWADALPSSWEELVELTAPVGPDGPLDFVVLRTRVRVEQPGLSEDGGDE